MTFYLAIALALTALVGAAANQLVITVRFSRISPALTREMDSDIGQSVLLLLLSLAALTWWLAGASYL